MLEQLLTEIRSCTICEKHLALGPNPVLTAHENSKIAIIGQAPGTKVHNSGKPWDDKSGERLRSWLNVNDEQFYDIQQFAIIPMGFCYPGKGKSGDLPPRKECAPQWHQPIWDLLPNIKLTLLIGQYAQKYYLKKQRAKNLTDTVLQYENYLPDYFVLPHPSPRNRYWLARHPWFEEGVIPRLQLEVKKALSS